ncbi:hypothetical protein [Pseudomonas sp. ANT_H12B]|uniref:hypothetical protein n=1 Tax=Pseudomonas sp. ANT_H12B TaxID=2597348 RepID=UPI0011EC6D57|nr:hypothetical protein [Pseudomonas sp. ANT_H12B]KAA0978049.1 hypothetical protein FQ185_02840 [Pseudomonas sp. ANT_H12B]
MCQLAMQVIYFIFVHQNGRRLLAFESCINYIDGDLVFLEDFLRNEPAMYEELFSPGCNGYVLVLLKKLMTEMKELKLEDSGEVLDGIEFIQNVGATALWKFKCDLTAELDSFVREYDRLDVAEERKRLYLFAQN